MSTITPHNDSLTYLKDYGYTVPIDFVPACICKQIDDVVLNNSHRDILTYRQAGGTTVLLHYALWKAFMADEKMDIVYCAYNTVNVRGILEAMLVVLKNRYVKDGKYHTIEQKLNTYNERIVMDGHRVVMTRDTGLLDAVRGRRNCLVLIDNAFWRSYDFEVQDTLEQLRLWNVPYVNLQSGLFTSLDNYFASATDIVRFPYYLSANYSLEVENSLINRLGENKYCLEYLLIKETENERRLF